MLIINVLRRIVRAAHRIEMVNFCRKKQGFLVEKQGLLVTKQGFSR